MSDSTKRLADFLTKNFPDRFGAGDPALTAIVLLREAYDLPEDQAPVPSKFEFRATVLYNKGLGRQTAELPGVIASSLDEAQKLAEEAAEEKIGKDKWIEVKVRPVGPAKAT
jgi:hypothetical protein